MIDFETKEMILDLNNRYVDCLDDNRLEEWPGHFTEDCLYRINARENADMGLTAYWLYFDHNRMLRDRVRALRTETIHNIHYDRHVVSNFMIEGVEGEDYLTRSNFVLVQSDVEGNSDLVCAGQYRDRVVIIDGKAKFKERTVIPDTFNPGRILATPL
jgi:anthranilate 1,2-dioxygenase small subunit